MNQSIMADRMAKTMAMQRTVASITYVLILASIFLNLIFAVSLLSASIKGKDITAHKKRLRGSLMYALILYGLMAVIVTIAQLRGVV